MQLASAVVEQTLRSFNPLACTAAAKCCLQQLSSGRMRPATALLSNQVTPLSPSVTQMMSAAHPSNKSQSHHPHGEMPSHCYCIHLQAVATALTYLTRCAAPTVSHTSTNARRAVKAAPQSLQKAAASPRQQQQAAAAAAALWMGI
jgi:hypothetical protein